MSYKYYNFLRHTESQPVRSLTLERVLTQQHTYAVYGERELVGGCQLASHTYRTVYNPHAAKDLPTSCTRKFSSLQKRQQSLRLRRLEICWLRLSSDVASREGDSQRSTRHNCLRHLQQIPHSPGDLRDAKLLICIWAPSAESK